MTNAAIADELVISEEMAKRHVCNLKAKLPVDDRKDVPTWMKAFNVETK